jgi:TolB-like protein/DNA-binding winged helix-turn-helix (wHTH) protein/Tfp pilus assembly protein PilF
MPDIVSPQKVVRFGEFEVDLRAGCLYKQGVKVRLREQLFVVLSMLLEHAGEVVTREELQKRLWPGDVFVDFEINLNTLIARLREVLGDSAEHPRYIETLPKRGYRFLVTASKCAASEPVPQRRFQNMADVQVALEELKDKSESGKLVPARRGPVRSGRPFAIAGTGLGAILITLIVLWKAGIFGGGSSDPSEPGPIRSIAVLPMDNLSGDPAQDYFVDAMTDSIIAELGKISGFERVISWQSMKRYKNSTRTAEQIADDVKVDVLVEGAVLREGNRVRISSRLIRVKPERQIWAESYDRDLREIMSLQSEVARTIAREVNVAVAAGVPDPAVAAPKVDPGAYDDYLRGNHYLERRMDEAPLRTAVQLFEKATAADPRFSDAYAQLAHANALLWFNYYDRTEQRRAAAETAARKALELEPGSARAHEAMAQVHYLGYLDYDQALKELTAARRLSPNDTQIQNLMAFIKRRQGRWKEAAELLEEVIRSDPRSAMPVFDLAVTYALLRRYEEAEPIFQRAISMDPSGQFYARQARFALLAGRPDLARAALTAAKDKAAEFILIPYYGYQIELYAKDYTAAEARLSLDTLQAYEWQWFYIPKALLRAQIAALRNRPDAARQDYEEARRILEDKLRAQPDDDRFFGSLGVAFAGLGLKKEAIEAGRKGLELCPMSKEAWRATFRLEDMARIYAMVGEHKKAIEQLKALLSIPAEISTAVLLIDPLWAPLKSDRGFQDLLLKYGR